MKPASNIYQYTDYRTLLRDHYDSARKRHPKWSYSVWAKRLGLKSPSALIMIVNGTRNPGPDLTRAIARYLGLGHEQSSFFEDLVRLQKAKRDPRLTTEILERLKNRHPSGSIRLLDDRSFSAISNWYFYAIRELVRLSDFQEDAHWICRKLKFKITPGQAKDALTKLVQLGLLARNDRGQLCQVESRVDTQSDIASEGLKRFHEQSLAHAKESIRNTPVPNREISGTTLAIKRESLQKAKILIRDFHSKLCDLLGEDEADEVYHLEIAFFPLTRTKFIPKSPLFERKTRET